MLESVLPDLRELDEPGVLRLALSEEGGEVLHAPLRRPQPPHQRLTRVQRGLKTIGGRRRGQPRPTQANLRGDGLCREVYICIKLCHSCKICMLE